MAYLALRVKGSRNDRLDILGVGRLDGGVLPVFQPGAGLARSYTIVTAEELTGRFDSLEPVGLPAFVTASLDYSDTEVELDLKAKLAKVPDLTPNQRAVGGAVDNAFNSGEDIPTEVNAALFGLTEDQLPQALDMHSGEIFASVQSVLIDQGLFVREALLGRLRQPTAAAPGADLALGYAAAAGASPTAAVFAPDPSLWVQGIGAWGEIDGDGNASGVTSDLGGIVGGIDVGVTDDWTVGVAFGYTQSHADIDDLASSADVESGLVGVYAGGAVGAWRLRAGGLYGLNFVDTTRSVTYPGFSETDKASYDAGLGQLFGEVAYAAEVQGVAVEPFGGLAWVHLHTDGFTEKGGAAALTASSGSSDVGYTTLGLRLATNWVLQNGMVLVPRASLAWQYGFGDLTPTAALAFADATAMNFTVAGAPIAKNAALIDAGVDLRISSRARLGLSYFGQLSEDAQESAVRGNFTWSF